MPWLCVGITNGEEAQTRAQAQAQVSWGGDGCPLLPPLHLFRFALRAAPREQGCAMKHTVNRSYLLLEAEERSSLIDTWLFRHQLYLAQLRLLWWVSRWRIRLQCSRQGFDPWVGKIHWRRKWQPTPVFLPGKSHGQRSLVGYSPWGCKGWTWLSDYTTPPPEQLRTSREGVLTQLMADYRYRIWGVFTISLTCVWQLF